MPVVFRRAATNDSTSRWYPRTLLEIVVRPRSSRSLRIQTESGVLIPSYRTWFGSSHGWFVPGAVVIGPERLRRSPGVEVVFLSLPSFDEYDRRRTCEGAGPAFRIRSPRLGSLYPGCEINRTIAPRPRSERSSMTLRAVHPPALAGLPQRFGMSFVSRITSRNGDSFRLWSVDEGRSPIGTADLYSASDSDRSGDGNEGLRPFSELI